MFDKQAVKQLIKNPLAAMLILAVTIIQMFIQDTLRRSNIASKECMEQVMYLRERVEKLETQTDAYTRTVLFKDMQIKKQSQLIDSLYRKGSLQ